MNSISLYRMTEPSVEVLDSLFACDENHGLLVWRTRSKTEFSAEAYWRGWNTKYSGKRAGHLASSGYVQVSIFGRLIYAHRIIYAMHYRAWPLNDIDHIDGNRSNNRIANLRDVARTVNSQNRRAPAKRSLTGLLGVTFDKQSGKYKSRICASGKVVTIGLFSSAEAAHAAYLQEKRKFHEGCTI